MIKFLVMDVDGTLTDGKIYMSDNGEIFKVFDVKDGSGIKDILPSLNIIPVIITARNSKILENRCNDLGINYLFQGFRNKLDKLKEVIEDYNKDNNTNYNLSHVAYIGDDLLDIPCLEEVNKFDGISACPSDSAKDVLNISKFVCNHNGGEGAVREFIEYLKKEENQNER